MVTASPLQPFKKLARTPEDLLQKLKTQGLVVANDTQALAYLRGVGAYRLKGYWHQALDPLTKQFKLGYEFEDIRQRCELDREVRAATIEAIDRLEVAIRSAMANYLSLRHSPHWFLDHHIFKPTQRWGIGQMIRKVEDEVRRVSGPNGKPSTRCGFRSARSRQYGRWRMTSSSCARECQLERASGAAKWWIRQERRERERDAMQRAVV